MIQSGPRRESAEVPFRDLLIYAGPTFAISTPLLLVQFYFLKFATDVLLVAPALVGVLFAVGRAWDAVSDPVVGTWSDRTTSRWGRRRPWMLGGIPLMAAAFATIWMPPASLEGGLLAAWLCAALLLYFTGFTTFLVPHMSLGAELSTLHHERTRIFGFRQASFIAGVFLAFAVIQYITTSTDERAAVRSVVLIALPIVCVLAALPSLLLRERAEYQGRGGESSLGSLLDVLRNRAASRLLLVQFIDSVGLGVVGTLAPFVAEYIVERPDLIGVLPAFFVVSQIAALPLWIYLSRRFGKKPVWLVSMWGAAVGFGLQVLVGPNDVALASGLLVVSGAFSGCSGALAPSLMADVIDGHERATGERKEGAYTAALTFALKTGVATIVILSGLALQASGFEPNAKQQTAAYVTIVGLYAGTPFIMFVVGALVFRGFHLDPAERAQVPVVLDARPGPVSSEEDPLART